MNEYNTYKNEVSGMDLKVKWYSCPSPQHEYVGGVEV
jgi:hypothetical protein